MLGLGQVVDAGIVAPTVGCKDQGSDEIEFAIAGSTFGIMCAVGFTAPCEITLAIAALVLHVLLAPAPKTVEYILLTELHGNHHTIRHSLGTGIVVLHIRHIAHRIVYLEVDLVRTAENIVKNLMQLRLDLSFIIAQLNKNITVLGTYRHRHCHENSDNY